jgi:hypothetical protein
MMPPRMTPPRLLAAALAVAAPLLAPAPVHACSVCMAGDPLVGAADAASEAGELRLALETEWLTAEADMVEPLGTVVREELTQRTLRLAAVWSPVPHVNVVLNAPLVRKSVHMTMPGMDHGTLEQTGLGDVELGVRWFALDRTNFARMRHQSVALSAGTSLPTGPSGAKDDAGVRIDEHAQLGTGGYGPYVGALYRLEQAEWHAFASLTGRVRTENRFGYTYGAAVAWTVQAQRQLGKRAAVGLGVDGREALPDREGGADVPHTGGLVLAAAPQLHWNAWRGVWLTVRGQLPILTRLRGNQEVGPVVIVGLQLRVM